MGHYTVKSAYALIRGSARVYQVNNNFAFQNKIWNLKIPLKVNIFSGDQFEDVFQQKIF